MTSSRYGRFSRDDALEAAPQRRLQVLRLRHRLAVDALRAREPDVVDHRRAEQQAGILAVAHHLAVRHLPRPVVPHDLIALVVRDHDEHRGVVARHRPEPHRAVAERAVAEVQDHRALAAHRDLGADGRARRRTRAIRRRCASTSSRRGRTAGARARGRALLHHHGVARQQLRRAAPRARPDGSRRRARARAPESSSRSMSVRRVRAHLGALLRPGGTCDRPLHARQRRGDRGERAPQLALRGDVQRVVAAHQQRVRADLDHGRLGDAAVHALASDEEQQVGPEAGGLGERPPTPDRCRSRAGDGSGSSAKIWRDGEHGRLEQLGQAHRLGRAPSRHTSSPNIRTGHCGLRRAAARSPRRSAARAGPGGSMRYCAPSPISRLEPLAIQQRRR